MENKTSITDQATNKNMASSLVLSDSSFGVSDRYRLLKNWVARAIVDKPEIFENNKTAVGIYADLYNIFCEDVQKAMKDLIMECREAK